MEGKDDIRKKIKYNVLFVSDEDTGNARQFSISLKSIICFLAVVTFLIIAELTYCIIRTGELARADGSILALKSQLAEAAKQNSELAAENETLREKVSILSETVNEKVHQEEERDAEIAKSHIPTGFPLRGTASYNEQEGELDGNPIAVFHAAPGTSVIATARGMIASIAGNPQEGYIVTVDHGNGYQTVYRNGAEPRVREGEEVTGTTELFNIDAAHRDLGYQIIENGSYIYPMEFMEIYG